MHTDEEIEAFLEAGGWITERHQRVEYCIGTFMDIMDVLAEKRKIRAKLQEEFTQIRKSVIPNKWRKRFY